MRLMFPPALQMALTLLQFMRFVPVRRIAASHFRRQPGWMLLVHIERGLKQIRGEGFRYHIMLEMLLFAGAGMPLNILAVIQ